MKPMTAVFGAVVVTAVLLFSAEPRHQRDVIRFIDRYAGNNYPPLTEWADKYDAETKSKTELTDPKGRSRRDKGELDWDANGR